MNSIGKEVAGISNQNNQTAFNFGKASDQGILEQEGSANTDYQSDNQTTKEDQQKNADAFEQAEEGQWPGMCGLFVFLCSLEKNNGNSIIQDGFSEDDCVQLWVDFVGIENGKNGDGIGC
jgi:hypothetical protein